MNSWGKQIPALGSADVGGSGSQPDLCVHVFLCVFLLSEALLFLEPKQKQILRGLELGTATINQFLQCKISEGFPGVIHPSSAIPSVGNSLE